MRLTAILTCLTSLAVVSSQNDEVFYDNTNVIQIVGDAHFKREVLNTNHLSLVEFYAPWCGYCKLLKPQYINAATKLKGKAKIVAVNCEEDANKNICQQYDIKGFPTIKSFIPQKVPKKARSGEDPAPKDPAPTIADYTGQRSAGGILAFASENIPNYVSTLASKRAIENFKKENSYRVVLLSSKKKTIAPPMFRSFAIQYLYGTNFAIVDDQSLWSEFGEEIPTTTSTIVIYAKGSNKPVLSKGDLSPESLKSFFSEHIPRARSDRLMDVEIVEEVTEEFVEQVAEQSQSDDIVDDSTVNDLEDEEEPPLKEGEKRKLSDEDKQALFEVLKKMQKQKEEASSAAVAAVTAKQPAAAVEELSSQFSPAEAEPETEAEPEPTPEPKPAKKSKKGKKGKKGKKSKKAKKEL